MGRAKQRADRIREEISITQVLSDYGYMVHAGYDGEQQFSCDLHGDGSDSKPSARVYPDSNSWYCFACGRTRDAIELVREKEGMEFWEAIKLLESRYGLPFLPWEDDEPRPQAFRADRIVAAAIDFSRTWEQETKRAYTFIKGLTDDRDLPMKTLLGYWEALDKITHMVEKDLLDERKGRQGLAKIRAAALEKLTEMNS